MRSRRILMTASVLLALAVAIGAFGAHVLKSYLSVDYQKVYETGVHYQFYGSLGALLVGILSLLMPSGLIFKGANLLIAGVILFSGSLYVLTISGIKWIGIITPLGGLSMIAGWICIFFALYKSDFSKLKLKQ